MKAIVTVIGKDKVGITAAVCSLLAQHNINILDITQTVLQDYFTMVMLVVVVAASYVRIEFQRSVEQFFDGIISTARDTAIEVDRGFCQALFGSAADTAGNDSIDFLGLQESD